MLDGTFIEEAHKIALKCLLNYGMSYGPKYYETLETSWLVSKLPSEDESGKRVWWRIPSKNITDSDIGVEFGFQGYVSINPGGFRTSPPCDEKSVVLDLPKKSPKYFKDLVNRWIIICQNDGECSSEIQKLKSLLNGKSSSFSKKSIGKYEFIYNLPIDEAFKKFGDEINSFYREDLFDYHYSLIDFSALISIIQLYVNLGVHDANCCFQNPSLTLKTLVDFISKSTDIDFLKNYKEYVEMLYKCAKEERIKALNSLSISAFYEKTYLSQHYFWTVWSLLLNVDCNKLGLAFNGHIAEEHFCNIMGGYSSVKVFFDESPLVLANTWSESFSNADYDNTKNHLKAKWSSIEKPLLPTFLFRLIFNYSYTLYLSKNNLLTESTIDRIQNEFNSIEQLLKGRKESFDVDGLYWFDFIKLQVAKQVGDSSEASLIAHRIMGREVARRVLTPKN